MKYKTLVFDLDGTLLNTLTDLTNSVNATLRLHGYPIHTEETVAHMVGNGIEKLVERALPGGQRTDNFDAILSDYYAHYDKHKADATAPYDGILPMLARLFDAGYQMAIVSNKIDSAVRMLAAQFFGDTVRVAFGVSDTVPKKPAPDAVFAALRELGATADGAVFIGDSEVDIETAANAGIPCISVGWGFRTVEELYDAGAACVLKTPAELADYLLEA